MWYFNKVILEKKIYMSNSISDVESNKRRIAWEKSLSNSYLSGIEPTYEMQIIANNFIYGKIDYKKTIELMIKHLSEL